MFESMILMSRELLPLNLTWIR